MKAMTLLVMGISLAACGADRAAPFDEPDPGLAPDRIHVGESFSRPAEVASLAGTPELEACRSGGAFDFQVYSRSLTAWEGREVTAVAFENDITVNPTEMTRVVWLRSTIVDGVFSMYCPRALNENYGYPSYGVFVDVDGDGACGTGDAGYQMQRYGWNDAVLEEIPSDGGFSTIASPGAPGTLGPPIGSPASDFCSGYFGG